jgi:hypothetical protein
MLIESGFDPDNPAFLETWRVFKQFATETVDTASDGLLFESGLYRFTGPERFTVHFTRQFEVLYEDGDHDHFEQLRCEFLYEPTEELRALGSLTLWCFPSDGESVADWCEEVEHTVEFEWAARLTPSQTEVSQEAV